MRPFSSLNRITFAVLAIIVCYWVWTIVLYQRQISDNQAFHENVVVPALNKTQQELYRLSQALNGQSSGKPVPLPPISEIDNAHLDEWLDRMSAVNKIADNRNAAEMAFMFVLLVWSCISAGITILFRRRLASPDRPANPNAGRLIGELIDVRRVFCAKAEDHSAARMLEIDGAHRRVTFHNFAFVTSFFRNPKLERVELPFSDLLVGLMHCANGHFILNLRTARGKVVIKDDVKPFPELVNLLLDAIELNRTNSIQYREALAREPMVRTPWYGWAIIVAAIAAVGVVFYSVLQK